MNDSDLGSTLKTRWTEIKNRAFTCTAAAGRVRVSHAVQLSHFLKEYACHLPLYFLSKQHKSAPPGLGASPPSLTGGYGDAKAVPAFAETLLC